MKKESFSVMFEMVISSNYKLFGREFGECRRKLLKLFDDVGIDKKIFLDGATYKFLEADVDILSKMLVYDRIEINRVSRGKFYNINEESLLKDVLFFCTFLEKYLDGKELIDAQNVVKQRLSIETAKMNQKKKWEQKVQKANSKIM